MRNNQSNPKILENYLNSLKIKDVKFEILNYSQNSDDILDHYVKYLEAKKKGEVDLYVLAMLGNDFFIKRDDKYPGKNQLYDDIAQKCGGIPIEESRSCADPKNERFFIQANLAASQNEINNCFFKLIIGNFEADSMIAFLVEDILFAQDENHQWFSPTSVYALHLKDKKIPVWSFPAVRVFDVDYDKILLSDAETHPNPTTHKAYAYYLALMLINEKFDNLIGDHSQKEKILERTTQLLMQEVAKLK